MKKLFENWVAPILILGTITLVFWLFIKQCERNKPETQFVDKVEVVRRDSIIHVLNTDNDSLRKLLANDSITKSDLRACIDKIKANRVIILEKIKTLPTDSGISMSQRNYADKSKLIKIDYEGKVKILVSESQLMENNIAFYNVQSLSTLNDTLNLMVETLNNENATKSSIIDNDIKIIEAMQFKGESKDTEIQGLKDEVLIKEKEIRKQKLLKTIAGTIGMFLLITMAVK